MPIPEFRCCEPPFFYSMSSSVPQKLQLRAEKKKAPSLILRQLCLRNNRTSRNNSFVSDTCQWYANCTEVVARSVFGVSVCSAWEPCLLRTAAFFSSKFRKSCCTSPRL